MPEHIENSKPLIVEKLDLDSLSRGFIITKENEFYEYRRLKCILLISLFSRGDIDFQFELFTEDDKLSDET